MAQILAFPGNPGAPVQPFRPDDAETFNAATRSEFGQLHPGYFKNAGEVIDAYHASPYVKRAAKAAADAMKGEAPAAKPVCASLLYEAAGRGNALAAGARDVGKLLESLGCIKQARTFFDLADIAETASAEVLAPVTPEGA